VKRKILFINSINPDRDIEIDRPPLGLGYLVSSLRESFGPDYIEFKIIDKNIEQTIIDFEPDIVGISSVTQNYNKAIQYAKIAKRHGLPVLVGGVHISLLPCTLTEDMDVGIIGEGEETIVELVNLFEKTGYFDPRELANIDGVVFRKNGTFAETKKRNPILPLDKIPLPAREFFTIRRSTYMFTSRGCPYRCSFCASSRFWDTVRFYSAEYVVNEIKYLVDRYKVELIQFNDDLFIADKKRLRQIVELLQNKGILDKVCFTCMVRSNLVDDELAYLLKKMNVVGVSIGLESAAPASLKYLKGDNITVDDHANALDILKKYGINAQAAFVIGSPKETEEEVMQSLDFIKQIRKEGKLAGFDIYVLTPYPGTPVWEYAKSRKLVGEDMDWDILDVNFGWNYENAVILSETLTRSEIYRLFLLFANEKRNFLIKRALRYPWKLLLKENRKYVFRALRRMLSGKSPIPIER